MRITITLNVPASYMTEEGEEDMMHVMDAVNEAVRDCEPNETMQVNALTNDGMKRVGKVSIEKVRRSKS